MTEPAAARKILDAAGVASAISRVAESIARELRGTQRILLAGIPTRGVVLAQRLGAALGALGVECRVGMVDISMYRDDLGLRGELPALRDTELPIDLDQWVVVLVDDVQQTGRTVRAAIEAVLAFGRPRRILYAVLADRGGRELPIRPDFTGAELQAGPGRRLRVRLAELDGDEGIYEA